jgi:hypothetical protein
MSEPIKSIDKTRDAKIKFHGLEFIEQINQRSNDKIKNYVKMKELAKSLKKLGY